MNTTLCGSLVLGALFFLSTVSYAAGDVMDIPITTRESISQTNIQPGSAKDTGTRPEKETRDTSREREGNFEGPWWQETLHDF